jgi:hypothetical protein
MVMDSLLTPLAIYGRFAGQAYKRYQKVPLSARPSMPSRLASHESSGRTARRCYLTFAAPTGETITVDSTLINIDGGFMIDECSPL